MAQVDRLPCIQYLSPCLIQLPFNNTCYATIRFELHSGYFYGPVIEIQFSIFTTFVSPGSVERNVRDSSPQGRLQGTLELGFGLESS